MGAGLSLIMNLLKGRQEEKEKEEIQRQKGDLADSISTSFNQSAEEQENKFSVLPLDKSVQRKLDAGEQGPAIPSAQLPRLDPKELRTLSLGQLRQLETVRVNNKLNSIESSKKAVSASNAFDIPLRDANDFVRLGDIGKRLVADEIKGGRDAAQGIAKARKQTKLAGTFIDQLRGGEQVPGEEVARGVSAFKSIGLTPETASKALQSQITGRAPFTEQRELKVDTLPGGQKQLISIGKETGNVLSTGVPFDPNKLSAEEIESSKAIGRSILGRPLTKDEGDAAGFLEGQEKLSYFTELNKAQESDKIPGPRTDEARQYHAQARQSLNSIIQGSQKLLGAPLEKGLREAMLKSLPLIETLRKAGKDFNTAASIAFSSVAEAEGVQVNQKKLTEFVQGIKKNRLSILKSLGVKDSKTPGTDNERTDNFEDSIDRELRQ